MAGERLLPTSRGSRNPTSHPRGPVQEFPHPWGFSAPWDIGWGQGAADATGNAPSSTPLMGRNPPSRAAVCKPLAVRGSLVSIHSLSSLKSQQVLPERPLPARPYSRQVLELPLWGSGGRGAGTTSALSAHQARRGQTHWASDKLQVQLCSSALKTTVQPAPLPEPRVQRDRQLAPLKKPHTHL